MEPLSSASGGLPASVSGSPTAPEGRHAALCVSCDAITTFVEQRMGAKPTTAHPITTTTPTGELIDDVFAALAALSTTARKKHASPKRWGALRVAITQTFSSNPCGTSNDDDDDDSDDAPLASQSSAGLMAANPTKRNRAEEPKEEEEVADGGRRPPARGWWHRQRTPAAGREVFRTMLRCAALHQPTAEAVRLLTEVDAGVADRCIRVLTKRECFAVLSASFFCLFRRESFDCLSRDGRLPSMNLDEMHAAGDHTGALEVEKLRMLLDYFIEVAARVEENDRRLDDPAHSLCVVRTRCTDDVVDGLLGHDRGSAASPIVALSPVEMKPIGASIDEQHDALRADFANAVLGGASLSFGCVQEEITFTICPELNVARLFCPPMEDEEAIVLLRAERFSAVQPGTYGFTLAYGAPYHDTQQEYRTSAIVAIDAADYRVGDPAVQYTPEAVVREVRKAIAGFGFDASKLGLESHSDASVVVPAVVATGNWGCGVFLGDASLKLVEQWVACSMAGRPMHYYPYDNADVIAEFETFRRVVVMSGVDAGGLLRCLCALPTATMSSSRRAPAVFAAISAMLEKGKVLNPGAV